MTRPKPPEHHTRKLRELLAADLLSRMDPPPGARPALSAALHGRRVCPPGAVYAPVGWAEYLKEEAAKAAKEAQ